MKLSQRVSWVAVFLAILLEITAIFFLCMLQRRGKIRISYVARLIELQSCMILYERDHGHLPLTIAEALSETAYCEYGTAYKYEKRFSGMMSSVPVFDGSGGWVYNRERRVLGVNRKGWNRCMLKIPVLEIIEKDTK